MADPVWRLAVGRWSSTCPRCRHVTVRVEPPVFFHVSYRRCSHCGEIWALDENDPEHPHLIAVAPERFPAKR
jgi:hypothetical protein